MQNREDSRYNRRQAAYRHMYKNIVSGGADAIYEWAQRQEPVPDDVADMPFNDELRQAVITKLSVEFNFNHTRLLGLLDMGVKDLDDKLLDLRSEVSHLSHYVVLGVKLVMADALMQKDDMEERIEELMGCCPSIRNLSDVMTCMDACYEVSTYIGEARRSIGAAARFLSDVERNASVVVSPSVSDAVVATMGEQGAVNSRTTAVRA